MDSLRDLLKRAEEGNPYRAKNDGFDKEKIMSPNKSSDRILNEVTELKDCIDNLRRLNELEKKSYYNLIEGLLKENENYRTIIDQQNKLIQTLMREICRDNNNKEFECIAFTPYI